MWYAARPPVKLARGENGNLEAQPILMNAPGTQLFNTAVSIHPPSYNAQFITTTTAGGELKTITEYNMPSPAIANATQPESQSQPTNYVTTLGK